MRMRKNEQGEKMQTALMTKQILAAIQNWEHWQEIQLGAEKEYGMPKEEFEKLLPEYEKFMGLIAHGHSGLGMFSAEVDKIWHTHILNTLRYEQFCITIFGKMIHHMPNLKAVPESKEPDCIEPGPSCKEPDPSPSCREPDPNPSCIEAPVPSHNCTYTVEQFRCAYISAYGPIPEDVWHLPAPDGSAITLD